jgi:MoaA/NifB/PqqE/SkfB family radical SAM enzyme
MVFGFGENALAREEQSIYNGYRAEAEALISEAERRAQAQGVRFRGAGALSPRESIIDRKPVDQPWRACSRPLRLAYVTAQGTALPCCIAPFTDAPYESITLGNYLRDGVAAVWTGEAYRVFRERLYSASPPTACQNCGLAWSL